MTSPADMRTAQHNGPRSAVANVRADADAPADSATPSRAATSEGVADGSAPPVTFAPSDRLRQQVREVAERERRRAAPSLDRTVASPLRAYPANGEASESAPGPQAEAGRSAPDEVAGKSADPTRTQVLRPPSQVVPAMALTAPMEAPTGSWMGLPVFMGLDADTLDRVVGALQPVVLKYDQVLMKQGEEGSDMFVLEHGSLQLEVAAADGAVAFRRTLSAPAVVGEMALITREPRTATVRAAEPCSLLRIDKPTFDHLCEENPTTANFLTSLVGERLLENKGIRKVGKYEVLGRLGAGGVATVFEARHAELQTSVALKMLSHSLVYDPNFAEYFGREGRMVAQLTHDNIVRVVDTEEAYGTRFIVMEKLTGEPLADLIKRGDRLEWNLVRRVLIELCDALAYAHEAGLLHRDVKSANVFLTENRRVKLLDFGIATQLGAPHDGDPQRVVGTPYYMSPEQIMGQVLDERSDLYSLGIVAYELCAHELPYTSSSIQQLFDLHLRGTLPHPRDRDPDIPDDLVTFIQRSAHRDRQQRFANCRDAGDYLRLAADQTSPDPTEMSSMAVSYLPSRRAQVQMILERTAEELRKLRGVQVVTANQMERNVSTSQLPAAPGASRN